MGYTKAELLEMIESASREINLFYKQDFINYRGKTKDTEELYSEVTAEWCMENRERFELIPMITRKSTYKTASHDGISKSINSNRKEERIAMEIFRQGFLGSLGQVIDYQTPLKNRRCDQAGKIDVLTYDGMSVCILELKEPDSKETMLRCVLEGYTYMKTVNGRRLINDFDLFEDAKLRSCPLVFKGGIQWQEMQEERPKLKMLMKMLNSKAFYLEKIDDKYKVLEEFENG